MSNKFQLPSALFTDVSKAGFELKLEEGQGFALITESREEDVTVAVDIPGVTVTVPKQGIDGAWAVGNALVFTLEGDLVAVAVNPEFIATTESLVEPAPAAPTKPAARKGAGARAQGCSKGNKLEDASF